ncbi:MAG: hypothetical protein ABWX85_09400 [Arthrobacter sp.]
MSDKNDETARRQHPQDGYAGSPTTQQMRTVGQRRRDAEEKLEHHLEETRRKKDPRPDDAADAAETGPVDSRDVADIQNDDKLSAADRVDLIANQVVTGDDDGHPASDNDTAP